MYPKGVQPTPTVNSWRGLSSHVSFHHDMSNTLIAGKFVSLTLQLLAVLLVLAETPTVVIILAAFAYLFGFMEGVLSLLRMIKK
jgi:hypothetical protein